MFLDGLLTFFKCVWGGHQRLLLPTGRRGLLGAYSSEKRKAQGALDQTELVAGGLAGGSVSGYTSGKGLSDAALPAFAAKNELPHLGQSEVRKENTQPHRDRTLAGPQGVQSIHLTTAMPSGAEVFPI